VPPVALICALKTSEIVAPCHRAGVAQYRFCGFMRPPSFAGKTGGNGNVKGGSGMAKLTLYHASPSRSSIVRWMLEEIGEPYDIRLLNLMEGDQQKPDYLAVNPMGKVPALKHGDVVVTEAAAICTYLADEFPRAHLNVPIGDPRRGLYLKWLFFGPGCVEPAIADRAFPRKEEPRRSALGYGDFDTVMNVLAKAVAKGPFLMGEQFTAADVVIGSTLRWGSMFNLLPKRPEFVDYVARLETRPALKRATALDQEHAAA
jgi:glutathione S-transferase